MALARADISINYSLESWPEHDASAVVDHAREMPETQSAITALAFSGCRERSEHLDARSGALRVSSHP